MFCRVEDFMAMWDDNEKGTLKVLNALTDDSLNQAVADGHRTIGRVAWHIIQTISEMMGQTGLKVDGPDGKSTPPADAASIRSAYAAAAASLVEQVKAQWTDETLKETDDMYGETWPRGMTLMILMTHEVHHRGQLTVLMRQAGLKVPGVFGPSKEEWVNHGAPAPTV